MEVEPNSVSARPEPGGGRGGLLDDGGVSAAPPPHHNNNHAALKRCSSAPTIAPERRGPTLALALDAHLVCRETSANATTPTPHGNPAPRTQRARRFSASFGPGFGSSPPLHAAHSPNSSGPRLTPRVSQLRQEECADVTNVREVAHERETHSAMQMSQSWEDLTLMGNGLGGPGSPTQAARFSPGVSPSPTRRAFSLASTTRRSLSPIAMRPSCLSPVGRPSGLAPVKRRFDLDEAPAAKRCCWSVDRLTPSTPGTPDSMADSSSGFTFRPVSPRASVSSPQSRTSQSPS